jgi:hypothetical protein
MLFFLNRLLTVGILFFLCSLYSVQNVIAQNSLLSGRVTSKKDPLPFATILLKGTNVGTNSNIDGYYMLKLPPGKHEIVFQYIGYTRESRTVTINSDQILDVSLEPEGITLKEVEVQAGEDPANQIIRQAIDKRKYYLHQVSTYSCQAYIKGLQKIKSIPKNIKGLLTLFRAEMSDTLDMKGVIYLSESESNYFYREPGDEKEIMFSSKVSGDNRSFSFNQLNEMKLNFYNNLIEMDNISRRPFISPINENAFLFYRYYLQGSIQEDGKTIHKIKVVPRRAGDPCFAGNIYIQEGTWRFTSVDLLLTKDVKIGFVDTLCVKQLHAPISGDSIWMPVTLNFSFDFRAFGFTGNGYFNAHISGYDLNPRFGDDFFRNEVLIVLEGSNKKDSSYWEQHRSVPLTDEEKFDYRAKDSTEKVRDTDRYKDSTDKVSNRLKFRDLMLGYQYVRTKRKLTIDVPGLLNNGVQYNTVEGLNLSYRFNLNKILEDHTQYNVSAKVRYGFSNKLWGGELAYERLLDPFKSTSMGIKIKSIAEQYNQLDPISPLINSIYSLFINENFMKIFRETGIEAFHSTEAVNGLFVTTRVRYMQRDPLKNTTDELIIDDRTKLFTSNDPRHTFTHDSMFTTNKAFTAELTLNIRFKQKYRTLPHQKVIEGSKFPRLTLSYKRAFPVLGTTADYDLTAVTVSDAIRLGLFGRFNYRVRGGGFLNFRQLYFMDFKYFLGNQTLFNTNDYLSSFRLLPYYTFSADRWFAEAHAEHHFQGFILGQIPLVKKLKVGEVAGIHYLSSNKLKYYYEINFGIERIWQILRVDYVLAYSPYAGLRQGVTIGLLLRF